MKSVQAPVYDRQELDRQYNARATVADVTPFLQEYASGSERARALLPCSLDVGYGPHPDETLDIFPATRPGSPVFVFIHGGYWRALSKDDSSFMAPAFVEAGATVVAVNYSLAPDAALDEIVAQCRRAVAWMAHEIHRFNGDPDQLHVCGSSAGGHLVGTLLSDDWQAEYGLPDDAIKSATPISGLFDLAPLIHTHVNAWTRLDEVSALRLSPLFNLPRRGCPLIVSYASTETAEFARQSDAFLQHWTARGFPGRYIPMPGTNHFNVIMALADPASPLTQAIFDAMGLGSRHALHGQKET